MKRIAVPAILAALGVVLAGCGSGHKAASNVTTLPRSIVDVSSSPDRFVVSGTATIPHVKPGTQIACKRGGPEVTVPAYVRVVKGADGKTHEVGELERGIELEPLPHGAVTVTCDKK